MKNAKRAAALILAASLAILPAGCKDDKSSESATATTTAAATTAATSADAGLTTTKATSASNSASAASSKAGSDLPALPNIRKSAKVYNTPADKKRPSDSFIKSVKGYTLKIKHPWNFGGKAGTSSSSLGNYKTAIKYVKDTYGATIEEIGVFQDYNKILQGEISANKFEYQMYEVQSFNFASYIKNNYMKNLRSAQNIAAINFTEAWYDFNNTQIAAINGGQYGWTSFDAEYTLPAGILYNKKLIKAANLTDPIVAARKGQWTWDTFESYALKLTTSSTPGFRIAAKDGPVLLSSLMSAMGTNLVELKKGSAPKSNITSQAGRDALAKIETWVKKKAVVFNADEDWAANKKLFADGKVAMTLASHDTLNLCTGSAVKNSIGIVPFPSKSASKTYKSVQDVQFISFIPSYYNNDTEVAKMLFLRDEEMRQLYRYREQMFVNSYKNYNLDDDSMAMAYLIKYASTDTSGVKYGKYVSAVSILDPDGSDADGMPNLTKIVHPVFKGAAASKQISSYGAALQKKYDSLWGSKVFTGNYDYNK